MEDQLDKYVDEIVTAFGPSHQTPEDEKKARQTVKRVLKKAITHEAAVTLGARGGKATSKIKQEASRANGAKGGRPRKVVQDA
jgi:hypothetical protein